MKMFEDIFDSTLYSVVFFIVGCYKDFSKGQGGQKESQIRACTTFKAFCMFF